MVRKCIVVMIPCFEKPYGNRVVRNDESDDQFRDDVEPNLLGRHCLDGSYQ